MEAITIDVADDDMVVYWATELDVSADDLKSALRKVGPSVKAVRDHFGK